MPCDTVQRTSVNVENLKAEDVELLAKALEDLGYTVAVGAGRLRATHPEHGTLTWDATSGKLRQETGRGQAPLEVNDLKVGYSKRVVQKVATRFGWSLKEQRAEGEQIAFAFIASKRAF
jgi:hypothetical protein